jgi:hypothetical protein
VNFITIHNLELDPNPDNLALYVIYMSLYIKPTSVTNYLTGIVHTLSAFYPSVNELQNSWLVWVAL